MDRGRFALEVRRARGGFASLLVLLAMTVAAGAIIANGLRLNFPWTKTYTARIAVDNAKGVVAGKQQVRISGLPVGKIDKVELDGGRPVLTITMKGRYAPLYRDARLRLRPKTPLDDLYLNVEDRGHESAGKLTADTVLPAERTLVPVPIGQVLNTLDANVRTRMEQAIDEVGQGLPDHGVQLRTALVALAPFLQAAQRLTRVTAQRRGQTRRLVHNLRLMMGELGRRDHQLRSLVRGGSQALGALGETDASLSEVLAQFPPTLRRLQPAFAALRASAAELDPAFDELQDSARELPGGLNALRRFSTDAEPALAALRKPLPQLRALVAALRPTSTQLDRAFAGLSEAPPRLNKVTAAIVPCEFAVQKFFNNTLSLMKFADARGLIPRGQTVDGASAGQRAGKSCAEGGPRK